MICDVCTVAKLSTEYAAAVPPAMQALPELRRMCKRTCLECLLAHPDMLPAIIDLSLLQRHLEQTSKSADFKQLVTESNEVRANSRNVLVQSVTGQRVEVEMPASGAVTDMKRAVAQKMGVPIRGMRLLLAGRELKARQGTLDTYGVSAGTQLQMIMAFSSFAGQNRIAGAALDQYGNAAGSQYDLTVDGAFEGMAIVVVQLYTSEGFDFAAPGAALQQKGFRVERFTDHSLPSPMALREVLSKDDVTQLWVISNSRCMLNRDHIAVIREFWEAGIGLYIWGDNDPYYADANAVTEALIGVEQRGNVTGDKAVGVSENGPGVRPHEISTGVTTVYEGITIATIDTSPRVQPLIVGSADNVVCAYCEEDGKRMLIDGGFTRLFYKWDSAGTARYIVNAAGWLVNFD